MGFKEILVLIVIVSILLVGCNVPIWKDTTKDTIAENKAEAPEDIEADNDEQPPAPPNDNEVLATTAEEKPPLPPTDDDNPLVPPPDENKVTSTNSLNESSTNPNEFVGLWRAYSSRIFYDTGGGGALGGGSGDSLEINADGTWQFSTSAGKWHIEDIVESDWKKWDSESYGPTRKMVLNGWNKDVADGPVEESDGRVDFFWVIYYVGPPTVGAPGQVQAKYGHTS